MSRHIRTQKQKLPDLPTPLKLLAKVRKPPPHSFTGITGSCATAATAAPAATLSIVPEVLLGAMTIHDL